MTFEWVIGEGGVGYASDGYSIRRGATMEICWLDMYSGCLEDARTKEISDADEVYLICIAMAPIRKVRQ